MRHPRATLPRAFGDRGNEALLQPVQEAGRFRDPVDAVVDTFPIAEFADVVPGPAARTIGQTLRARLRADIRGVREPAEAAALAADKRLLDRLLRQEEEPTEARSPVEPAHQRTKQAGPRRAISEDQ